MIVLSFPELLAVAAHVLRASSAEVVERTDFDAVAVTLEETRQAAAGDDDAAPAAAALLSGLVRRRPFVRANRRIAVAATLQMLARNDWDLALDPAKTDRLLDEIAHGAVPAARLTKLLRATLRPLTGERLSIAEGRRFERSTDRVRHVVVRAQAEARQLDHGYIGTEHILLGLVTERASRAGQVLDELGVAIDAARAQVREVTGKGGRAPKAGHIPFTPQAKQLLELSLREAVDLGDSHLGTEHILLALVRDGESAGARVLVKLGVDLESVRQRVVALVAGDAPPESVPAGKTGLMATRHAADAALLTEVEVLVEENDRLRRRVEQLEGQLHGHGIAPDQPDDPGTQTGNRGAA
jgi:prophage maintenance system killer protein